MPRLSIIITSHHGVAELETTLVSVLENRPKDCEILVALGHAYNDPYRLEGEVRFLADAGRNWLQSAATALNECDGAFVHLLASGTTVGEDWTDAPLSHFERDPQIASVAPLVFNAAHPTQIALAGLEYRRGGRRRERKTTLAASRIGQSQFHAEVVLGPAHTAAFYRREALESVGGFSPAAGPSLADVDTALSLAELGYLSILEPRSAVYVPHVKTAREDTFAAGRRAEAVFWRHAGAMGWTSSLVAHGMSLCAEAASVVLHPAAIKRLLGRAAGVCLAPHYARHAAWLRTRHPLDGDQGQSPATLPIPSVERASAQSQRRAA